VMMKQFCQEYFRTTFCRYFDYLSTFSAKLNILSFEKHFGWNFFTKLIQKTTLKSSPSNTSSHNFQRKRAKRVTYKLIYESNGFLSAIA
jgi:hypothetical protein